MEVMKETLKLPEYQPRFEDPASLLRRRTIVEEFMKEYLRMNPLTGQEKYGIVCHSMLMATMTCEGLNPNDKFGLLNYTWA